MNQSPPDLDVVAAFRRQLAELPEPGRHRRRVPAAAAVAVLAFVPLVVAFSGTDRTSAALAITRDATSLELRIADATAEAGEMTRELNDAGIRGRVTVVPVPAQRVGQWVVTAEIAKPTTCVAAPGTPPQQEQTVRLNDIENTGSALRIPISRVRESEGIFVLVAGREARSDERPVDLESPATVNQVLSADTPDPRLKTC